MRWQGKTGGAFGFALNFLWLLSLFQDKESNKQAIGRKKNLQQISHCVRNDKARGVMNSEEYLG